MRGLPSRRAAVGFGVSALLVAVAVTAVAACTSRSAAGDSSAPAAAGAAGGAATQAAPERATAAPGTQADGGASAPDASGGSGEQQLATVPVDGTKVIKTADLTVRLEVQPVPPTDDAAAVRDANARARSDAVAASAASVRGIAGTAGGFVASAAGGGSQMSITLRVPAEQYDAVLDKITGIGQVTDRTRTAGRHRADRRRQQSGRQHDRQRDPGAGPARSGDQRRRHHFDRIRAGHPGGGSRGVATAAGLPAGTGRDVHRHGEPVRGDPPGARRRRARTGQRIHRRDQSGLGGAARLPVVVGCRGGRIPALPAARRGRRGCALVARRLRRSSRTRRSDAPASTQDGTQEQAPEPAGVG